MKSIIFSKKFHSKCSGFSATCHGRTRASERRLSTARSFKNDQLCIENEELLYFECFLLAGAILNMDVNPKTLEIQGRYEYCELQSKSPILFLNFADIMENCLLKLMIYD